MNFPVPARRKRCSTPCSTQAAFLFYALASSVALAADDAVDFIDADDEDLVFQFDQVVVTATRGEKELARAPASMSVVTHEELQKAPMGDLTDAIRNTPGISLNAGSQGRRNISIRGMDSSYTLILVDGKRVNSSESVFRHNDFDTAMIPVEAIERIEVVRGSMSSLYGSDAMGGVINIITRPIADEWTGGVDLKGQTPVAGTGGQEGRASFYASGPLVKDKLALRVTGAFDKRRVWHGEANPADDVVDAKGQVVRRPDESVFKRGDIASLEGRDDHNGRARLVWTPTERQTVTAEYGLAYQAREGEYFIADKYGAADTRLWRNDAVVGHEGKWGWGTTTLRGYWEGSDTGLDEIHQNNYVFEGHANAAFGSHLLTVGLEGRWTGLESADFTSGAASVHQEALYAQNEWEILDNLTLLVGARLDHHRDFGFYPTPRGYVVYNPVENLTLKGGVGTGFKSPTLRQLSAESIVTSCRGACVIVGSSDLKPETSTNFELSAGWDTRNWGATVGGFHNEVANLIDTPRGAGVDPVGHTADGLDIFVPRNVNKARVRGVEASGRWSPTKALKFNANYTLVDARDLDADKLLDNRPRHTVNAQADWRVIEKLGVFARGQYIGEQQSGVETIDGYALFDAGVTYKPTSHIGVTGGILNIADTRSRRDDGYSYQERGRTVYLGLNATL